MDCRKLVVLACFSFLVFSSCLRFNDKEQIYPDTEFSSIQKVLLHGSTIKSIENRDDLMTIGDIFKDSTNYYFDENVTWNENPMEYTIDVISENDTLSLQVFPTDNPQKFEMGFLDKYDYIEPNKFRKFNRFYMNAKLVDFIKEKGN